MFFRSCNQVFLILNSDLRIWNHFGKKKRMRTSAGFADQPKNTEPNHTRLYFDFPGIISMSDQTAGLSAATSKLFQGNCIYYIIIIRLAQKITRRNLYCNHPFHPLSHSTRLLQANLKLLCQSSKGYFLKYFETSNHHLYSRCKDTAVLKIIYKLNPIFIILLTVIEVTENLPKCCIALFNNMGKYLKFSAFKFKSKQGTVFWEL